MADPILGTPGNDTLSGTPGSDTIRGLAGDDTLTGLGDFDIIRPGPGNDTLNGGTPNGPAGDAGNTLDYADLQTGIVLVADAGAGVVTSLNKRDTFQNFILFTGTRFDDTFTTGSLTVEGFYSITGSNGDDVVNGNSAFDELRFEEAIITRGIVANLVTGKIVDGFGDTDTVSGIERIRATRFADVFIGSDAPENFQPYGGTDNVDGGGGIDEISFFRDFDVRDVNGNFGLNGVTVDLGNGFAIDGYGYRDTIRNVENVFGTLQVDRITGSGGEELFRGSDGNDILRGLGGSDSLAGDNGNDTIDGGAGADTMTGGTGDDTYEVDDAGDVIIEGTNGGFEIVHSRVSMVLAPAIEVLELTGIGNLNGTGNALTNRIVGNASANVLNGQGGPDVLIGGLGNDTYIVDDRGESITEQPNQGIDIVQTTVDWTLGLNFEQLVVLGAATRGTGNNLDNLITGNANVNTLNGAAGNDTLDGGAGNDTMVGGPGDDLFIVGSAGDVTTELTGGGTDTVRADTNHTLGAFVENLFLLGASIVGTGNDLANRIVGNAGNNVLDGLAGADTLTGDLGDDTYVVDDARDVLIEKPSQGTDLVRANISWALGLNLENLTLLGSGDINGTGNNLANTITGNGGDNTLNGAAGNDTMIGGLGDDTFIVGSPGDVVSERALEGTDTVRADMSWTLLANFENLVLLGTASTSGTGNSIINEITGNSGANVIDGKERSDILTGGTGRDTFVFSTGLGTTNIDDITDFSVADDSFRLMRSIFTTVSSTNGVLNASQFVTGTAAVDADDRIIYNTVTGEVAYDSDGFGGRIAFVFATVDPRLALTNLDFLVT